MSDEEKAAMEFAAELRDEALNLVEEIANYRCDVWKFDGYGKFVSWMRNVLTSDGDRFVLLLLLDSVPMLQRLRMFYWANDIDNYGLTKELIRTWDVLVGVEDRVRGMIALCEHCRGDKVSRPQRCIDFWKEKQAEMRERESRSKV